MAESDAKLPEASTAEIPIHAASSSKQTVDPWNVAGEIGADGVAKAIDYNALIVDFGTKKILAEDLERFEKVTGHKPHRFMRRGIVFSHRDLNVILDRYERGEPFYLYTGRGPSSDSMHIGHTVPFEFTKWLQDVLDVPLIIQLTDDEKFMRSEGGRKKLRECKGYTKLNAKDIIAVGFDTKKTFIFGDLDFVGGAFFENVTLMGQRITNNVARAVFGFTGESNVALNNFASIQGATAFASSFPHIFGDDDEKNDKIPCLIPCAIDQDPYFRLTRDVAAKLHFAKPSLIHARFLDALQGPGSKMSASVDSSAIFLKDTPAQIKNKVNKYAYSGGSQDTEAEQRAKGGDTEQNVSFQYLSYFLEDDEELEKIQVDYRTGKLLTGELKAKCIAVLQEYVGNFQEKHKAVTDEVIEDFFAKKKLVWAGNQNPIKVEKEATTEGETGEFGPTKNQLKKLEKQRMIDEKKAAKEAAKASKSGTS